MPKITGPNIARHVADQEVAVFQAATSLFAEHGVNNVSMSDIAKAVGLKRPSLYRYFPTKSAIVFRWFEHTMIPLIAASEAIADGDQPRSERFDRWMNEQLSFLSEPGNQAMIRASVETTELTQAQLAEVGARHRDLYATLSTLVTDPAQRADNKTVRTRVLLIAGVLRSYADLRRAPISDRMARLELLRAARLIADI